MILYTNPTVRRGKKYRTPVEADVYETNDRIFLSFPYNTYLKDQIKAMAGARWHPDDKQWSILKNERNLFRLDILKGINRYEPYDRPLIQAELHGRLCYKCHGNGCSRCNNIGVINHYMHQLEMFLFGITRRRCIIAAEMGTGKTLVAIEILDYLLRTYGIDNSYYIGPRSALAAVRLEFERWRAKSQPKFLTYEGLKSIAELEETCPQVIFFDEMSRLKTLLSQRTQAARMVADRMRQHYGDNAYIIGMSGTPAPKNPLDWYSLAELACPGFLLEGTLVKFQNRLAITIMKESPAGGVYPQLVSWRDDEKKCNICGKMANDFDHEVVTDNYHNYVPSVNEVSKLYQRLKGLVIVKTKADCLDLPELRYEIIRLEPSLETLNALEILRAKSARAIQFLTWARELSDGFLYKERVEGTCSCPLCQGTGKISSRLAAIPSAKICPSCGMATFAGLNYCEECGADINQELTCIHCNAPASYDDQVCRHCDRNAFFGECKFCHKDGVNQFDRCEECNEDQSEAVMVDCTKCNGTGVVDRLVRWTEQLHTPKDGAIKDKLDEQEDVGRLVMYAGFQGSTDKLVDICHKAKWATIKVDGRGWVSDIAKSDMEMIRAFQDSDQERIAFIAHPKSGGMGLTLTASPSTVFYSNSFEAEDRWQGKNRIHRPGMDVNRGATIYDLFHLETDEYVWQNLEKKRRLQDLTMGILNEEMKHGAKS